MSLPDGDPNVQLPLVAANGGEGGRLEPDIMRPNPVANNVANEQNVLPDDDNLNALNANVIQVNDWALVQIQAILQQLESQPFLTQIGQSQLVHASNMLMSYLTDPNNANQEKSLQAQLLLQMVHQLDSRQVQSVANLSPMASRTSLHDHGAPVDVGAYLKRARLPDFSKLMKFDSKDILEYPMYRANMRQLVIKNDAYTPQQKHNAFCQTLDKEARSFLLSINPEEPDLEKVLQILDDQFLRGTTVEDALRNVIQSAPPLTKTSTLQEWHQFRAMVDSMNARVKAGTLNSTAEHHFHMELIGKMPYYDQNLARMEGTDIQSLANVVEKCIRRTRLIGEQTTHRESKTPQHSPRRDSRFHPYGKMSNHQEGRSSQVYVTKETCFFCNGLHGMNDCPESLSLKRQKVIDSSLCFKCLDEFQPGHYCGKRCPNCRGRHHASMCQVKVSNKQDQSQWPTRRSTSTTANTESSTSGSA